MTSRYDREDQSCGVGVTRSAETRRYSCHMELHARPNAEGAWVVTLLGELDLAAVPRIRAETQEALRDGWVDVIVDLSQVDFVDSAGIGVLIGLRKRTLDAGGSLTLRASEAVSSLLATSEVEALFDVQSVGSTP